MKKLVFILLITLSYASYADSTCTQRGKKIICKEYTNQHDEEWEQIDYKAAGQGLRNILRWLNENSTTNSNSSNNSGGLIPHNAYKSGNGWKCVSGYEAWNGSCRRTKAYNSSINCSKGYKKVGSSCVYIKEKFVYIPPNAYAYKNTWKCYDGYKKSGNSCIKHSR